MSDTDSSSLGEPDSQVEPDSLVEPDSPVEPDPQVEPDSLVEPVETTTPLLRVVAGDPTPEELAALVAVVAASAGSTPPPAPGPRSEWAAPRHRLRAAHRHGPGAWRASGR